MEKPLLWYVCQVAWLTLLAFRYHLGRFRDLTFTIPPYHSLLCFFRYQLGRFRHWVLNICAVSSQSCLQPWQNLGRKGESQMLPIPLIPIWLQHSHYAAMTTLPLSQSLSPPRRPSCWCELFSAGAGTNEETPKVRRSYSTCVHDYVRISWTWQIANEFSQPWNSNSFGERDGDVDFSGGPRALGDDLCAAGAVALLRAGRFGA